VFTILQARKVLTMNPSNPVATHVAIRDGRILGAGSFDELAGWGPHRLEEELADRVLLPGFVEGHSHAVEGVFWEFVYCGSFDRTDPDGRTWSGVRTVDELLQRLAQALGELQDPSAPLTGWALDPTHLGSGPLHRGQLDALSRDRPIGLMHASVHILNVNTRALELAGLMRQGVVHEGIPLGEDGYPTGELRGHAAYGLVAPHVGFDTKRQVSDPRGLRQFGRLCIRKGITTATDLANPLPGDTVSRMQEVVDAPDYPVRLLPFQLFTGTPAGEFCERFRELAGQNSDRLRVTGIKALLDGSIQGFSARLRWPGYYNGAPNGLWYTSPEQLGTLLLAALGADIPVHMHVNGDEAIDLAMDLVEEALHARPRPDHRTTLQHCQMGDAAQFRRMRALGLCANLFVNHLFFWGDQHYATTLGPERAMRMNACATALANGVPLAIHSDAPVTPLDPLFTAWCAMHRQTATGRVLGPRERLETADALRAITLGAAWTLKLDHEIGSIETGKRADFAVLEEDPTAADAPELKEIRVWGTIQDGRLFPASGA
jgi:predicted amidohydrolase YtcJ